MSGLDLWLKQATRHLSRHSAAQVRSEICEHYHSAREAALHGGATAGHAEQVALASLGNARTANRQYRKVLLTSAEASLLREGNWEAQVICSHPRLKSLLAGLPLLALLAGLVLFRAGSVEVARILLVAGMGTAIFFLAPLLPIYTPARGRIARSVKWVVLAAMPVMAFWPDILKFFWLLMAILWPVFYIEWTRTSIRRKLPVAQWPKHLYL